MSLPTRSVSSTATSGIAWHGVGRTAFAIPLAVGATRSVRECKDAASLAAVLGPGRDSPRAQSVSDFFAAGGQPCLLWCDERLYEAGWIGDSLGPGLASGLHALLERDDVGTVVILSAESQAASSRREELIVNLAAEHGDVLFVLEAGLSGEASRFPGAVYSLRPNVVLVAPELVSVGSLAGYLEAGDWRPDACYRQREPQPPAGIDRDALIDVRRWRRHAGLRRAVDLGTRWVLFEPSHALLWRSVERDVSAFLGRLERWGFFESGELKPPVFCGPHAEAQDAETQDYMASAAHLVLRINSEQQVYVEE